MSLGGQPEGSGGERNVKMDDDDDDDGLPPAACCSLPSAQDQYPLNPLTPAAGVGGVLGGTGVGRGGI